MLEALGGRTTTLRYLLRPISQTISNPTSHHENFAPGKPLPHTQERTAGHRRPGGRGVVLRNFIVVQVPSYAQPALRQLAALTHKIAASHDHIDGVVAVAHTEGAADPNPQSRPTPHAGWIYGPPNVGAVLAVDYGSEAINNESLRAYMEENGYALHAVPHRFMRIERDFVDQLETAEAQIRAWFS